MSDLTNNISYLKGLADGMKLAEKSDEGSIITKMIETFELIADEIGDLDDRCVDMEDFNDTVDHELDSIGMELNKIEDIIEEMSEDYDPEADYDDNFVDVDDDDYLFEDDEDDDDFFDDEEEDGLFEISCPECGEDVIVDFDMLDDENSIVCPNCHHEIDLEFDIPEEEVDEDEEEDDDEPID